jgi:hypothetical protein
MTGLPEGESSAGCWNPDGINTPLSDPSIARSLSGPQLSTSPNSSDEVYRMARENFNHGIPYPTSLGQRYPTFSKDLKVIRMMLKRLF